MKNDFLLLFFSNIEECVTLPGADHLPDVGYGCFLQSKETWYIFNTLRPTILVLSRIHTSRVLYLQKSFYIQVNIFAPGWRHR